MKRLLLIIYTCACVGLAMQARNRSEAQMVQAAADVLLPAATTRAAAMPQVLHSTPQYSVVGYAAGGFAVIAADDGVEAVLGYAPTAVYDSEALPEGLQWWMNGVGEALSASPRYSRSSTARYNTTGVESVAPMLSTQWGQGEPYNLQCPFKIYSNTGNMATGCIATAMAQIMRYWQYPETGDGDAVFDIRYYLYADYASTHYDWASMLPRYDAGTYQDAQADAVAELMMHCGVSVHMRYTDDESGAQAQYVPGAMRDHFRYNRNVGYRNRAYHNDAEWMGSIYKELAAGRPILYTGQDSLMSYGHAFVFDGFDADGLVHVNWGWDGLHDGYFDINILNSGFLGLSFTELQSMVMGIGMPSDEIEHTVEIGIKTDLSLYTSPKGDNVFVLSDEDFLIANLNDYDLRGTIAMVLPTRFSTRVLATLETFPGIDAWGEPVEAFESFTYRYYPDEYEITIPRTLSNGTYYMYLAFCEEGSSEWQPLWAAEGVVAFFQVKKEGNNFEVVGVRGQYATPVAAPAGFAAADGAAYNLQGQRVNQQSRGVVIKNGKKYLKK